MSNFLFVDGADPHSAFVTAEYGSYQIRCHRHQLQTMEYWDFDVYHVHGDAVHVCTDEMYSGYNDCILSAMVYIYEHIERSHRR